MPPPRRSWVRVAAVFCGFALVCNFVPSEPFLTPYLLDDKHFTEDELNNRIYAVSTYAFTAFLLVVGPVAELVGYKALVVGNAASHVVTRLMLIWGTTIGAMQFMQVTYGLAMACEVVYFAFVYKLVDEAHFQRLTSLTRAATLLSRVFSGVLAQVLVTFAGVPLVTLFYVSFASSCIALVQSLWFPGSDPVLFAKADTPTDARAGRLGAALAEICRQTVEGAAYVRKTYGDGTLLWLSLLWCTAQCAILAIEGYASSLWYEVDPAVEYNGFVDSAARMFGAAGAFLPAVLNLQSHKGIPGVLTVLSCTLAAALVVAMSFANSIWVCYVGYIGFEGLMYFMTAIIAVQIASRIADDRFAFVFGLNMFFAAGMFTLMQIVVSSLGMTITARFHVYSGYIVAVVIIAVIAAWRAFAVATAAYPIDFHALGSGSVGAGTDTLMSASSDELDEFLDDGDGGLGEAEMVALRMGIIR